MAYLDNQIVSREANVSSLLLLVPQIIINVNNFMFKDRIVIF
jgi:hypothetical protein